VNTSLPIGSLPDFELSKLWLHPSFSTVDLREVKSVRLKVDVHGVHAEQARRSALFCDLKNSKQMSVFAASGASFFVCPEFGR